LTVTSYKQTDEWIDSVYRAPSREALKATYDQWEQSYDADMVLTGYMHYAVLAGLVGRHVLHKDATLLDAGVGTGGLGAVLSLLGYNNLSGLDMSEGMLARAASRKCYSDLRLGVLGEKLDYVDRSFDAIVSTGTFTEGHAPASALDELVRVLETGGVMIFTMAGMVWEEKGFKVKLEGFVAAGVLKLVEVTQPYQPMPYSPAESHITTRAYVYRKVG
jgi:ubiquinone/menaquinone biosynthesis C-methylase UbiE